LGDIQEVLFNRYPYDSKDKGIKIVGDNGSQPISRNFIKFCSEQGNAETKRKIRTIKEFLEFYKMNSSEG